MNEQKGYSVRERGGGFQVRVRVLREDGTWGTLSKAWPTEKSAHRWGQKQVRDKETNQLVRSPRLTFGQYLVDVWLPMMKTQVQASSWTRYDSIVRTHLRPRLGSKRLDALTPQDFDRLYGELVKAGARKDRKKGALTPRTIRYVHVTAVKALGDAVRKRQLATNPAALASPPRMTRRKMNCWNALELRRFLAHVRERDSRLYAAWLLACTTGVRRQELLDIRRGDVDLDGGQVFVRKSKTASGVRAIAVDEQTLAVLRAHMLRQAEERLELGDPPGPDDLLFAELDGAALHANLFAKRFHRLADDAGLPRIRFHDLRHSAATVALQSGVAPHVVSARLGHSNVGFTLSTYAHVLPAVERAAAEQVAGLILGRSQ